MKRILIVAGLLGLALATYIIVRVGAGTVAEALLIVGWGIVPVMLYQFVPLTVSTLSWRELIPTGFRPRLVALVWARWIRDSVNNLLPVGQVGGDLVCVRLAHAMGVPGAAAAASMVVDLTVGVATQLVFVVIGLALLLEISAEPSVAASASAVLAGIAIFIVAMAIFIAVQNRGIFGIVLKIAGGLLNSDRLSAIAGKGEAVDGAVRSLYRSRSSLIRSSLYRLVAWAAGAGEVWLIMYFLGHPVTAAEAVVIQSFGQGVRSAAFMVPGALGVLEGGYLVFGSFFGITPELSLAMALCKRVRELGLGVPGLIAWQIAEGRRLVVNRKA